MIRRNTIQKDFVLQTVRSLKSHVTAEQVYETIIQNHPSVGKGTVYRNLSILAEEGQIKKIEIPDGADCYDFNLEKHYHVRCVKCNKVFDVDLEAIDDLSKKIRDKQGMMFLDYDILFKGVCSECQNQTGG